jgi:hypothetical protein
MVFLTYALHFKLDMTATETGSSYISRSTTDRHAVSTAMHTFSGHLTRRTHRRRPPTPIPTLEMQYSDRQTGSTYM